MAFNYKAAKQEGYSDDEIGSYLKKTGRSLKSVKPTWMEKAKDLPIAGPLLEFPLTVGASLGASAKQPIVEKKTREMQKMSLDLAKQAQQEKDPKKKEKLLDKSRKISRDATKRAEEFKNVVESSLGEFKDRETPEGIKETVGAYAPMGLRTGVTYGTMAAGGLFGPGLTGITAPGTALTQSALGRVAGAGITGLTTGSLYGAAYEEEADVAERLEMALLGGMGSAVTSMAFQVVVEGGFKIKDVLKKMSSKAKNKFNDWYQSTLKSNMRDKKFYQQAGGKDAVVKKAMKHNIPPTKGGVEKELSRYGPEYDRVITKEASVAENKGRTIDIAGAFKRAKQHILKRFGHDDTLKSSAQKWFDQNAYKYANQTNAAPKSANKLRMRFDQKTGALLTQDTTGWNAARKAFASELRGEFKNVVSPKARLAIEKYQLLAGLSDAFMKEPKAGIVEMAGAAAMPMTGAFGNLLEFLLSKAARSPGLRRYMARQGMLNMPGVGTGVSLEGQVSPSMMQLLTDWAMSQLGSEQEAE